MARVAVDSIQMRWWRDRIFHNCCCCFVWTNEYEGAFGRQQKMRDMGVDKLFQSVLMYSDQNLTEVYVHYTSELLFSTYL